jgi:DNA repair exonuclease SbcCD ATPase subunit
MMGELESNYEQPPTERYILRNRIAELEQQLAQAQDDKQQVIAQRDDRQAELTLAFHEIGRLHSEQATMRALLEEITPHAYSILRSAYVCCDICGESFPFDGTSDEHFQRAFEQVTHDEDCPIAKARAYLAAHPAQEQTDA